VENLWYKRDPTNKKKNQQEDWSSLVAEEKGFNWEEQDRLS
jgi:hypothetical protein